MIKKRSYPCYLGENIVERPGEERATKGYYCDRSDAYKCKPYYVCINGDRCNHKEQCKSEVKGVILKRIKRLKKLDYNPVTDPPKSLFD